MNEEKILNLKVDGLKKFLKSKNIKPKGRKADLQKL